MITEEKIFFNSGPLRLAGILGYPEVGCPIRAVLLCGPHPNFAGNMNNNVVRALFHALAPNSIVFRFDYRGIGESEIRLHGDYSKYDYWNEVEERKEYSDIVNDVKAAYCALNEVDPRIPIYIAGYSFGAIVGLQAGIQLKRPPVKMVGISPPLLRYSFDFLHDCTVPCLLISGRNDFVFADGENQEAVHWPSTVSQRILDGEDHFFREREPIVVEETMTFLNARDSASRSHP